MIDEIHTTITTYQGFQVSIEVLRNGRWRYLGFGVSSTRADATYGTAVDADVDDTLRTLATYECEPAARYAASHMSHSRKLFEYRFHGHKMVNE